MTKILYKADPAAGGGGPGTSPPAAQPPNSTPTIGSLTAENAALKSRLAFYEAKEAQTLADETAIAEKMRVGLRRPQAIAVIKRQREWEILQKRLAEEKAAKAAAKAAAAIK